MSHMVQAKIQWVPAEAGGRRQLPHGSGYSTVARFEDDAASWPGVAWSIVLERNEPADAALETVAAIRFLVSDAPSQLLRPGSRFELFEGHRVIAHGQVLS